MNNSDVLVFLAIYWIVASIGVAAYANGRGLSTPIYFFAAIFFGPPFAFVGAAAANPTPPYMDRKKCPDCFEMITAEARKCRFCGCTFDEESIRKARQRKPGDLQ